MNNQVVFEKKKNKFLRSQAPWPWKNMVLVPVVLVGFMEQLVRLNFNCNINEAS